MLTMGTECFGVNNGGDSVSVLTMVTACFCVKNGDRVNTGDTVI